MRIDWLLDSLVIMWKGMLGIFIVTAVIIGCIVLLNRLTAAKRDGGADDRQS